MCCTQHSENCCILCSQLLIRDPTCYKTPMFVFWKESRLMTNCPISSTPQSPSQKSNLPCVDHGRYVSNILANRNILAASLEHAVSCTIIPVYINIFKYCKSYSPKRSMCHLTRIRHYPCLSYLYHLNPKICTHYRFDEHILFKKQMCTQRIWSTTLYQSFTAKSNRVLKGYLSKHQGSITLPPTLSLTPFLQCCCLRKEVVKL